MNRKERRIEKKHGGSGDRLFADALRLHQAGRPAQAEPLYRQVLAKDPRDSDCLHLLGVIALESGRAAEAATLVQQAIAINPAVSSYHCSQGNVQRVQGQPSPAVTSYRRALHLKPGYPEALNGLGNALADLGRDDEAVAAYRQALAARPDYAEAASNLGVVFVEQGRPDLALGFLRRALDLHPGLVEAHNNFGAALRDLGQPEAAAQHFVQARALRPDFLLAYSNHLQTLNEFQLGTPAERRVLAEQFGAQAAAQVQTPFTQWPDRAAGGPLRVGLVSGDLLAHPVGHAVEALLGAVNPDRIAFHVFSSNPGEDELTRRIRPLCASWRQIHAAPDAVVANLIHSSGVDILLDLSGHAPRTRLPVFAWRPAPVQASWMGHFGATGLAAMDYIIADPHVAPASEACHFTETVWTLPEIFCCFGVPAITAPLTTLPALAAGVVTFGAFHEMKRMTGPVMALWARALQAVPGSRLVLAAPQMRDPVLQEALRKGFAAHGIAADRLTIEGGMASEDRLRRYAAIDIALDIFPAPDGAANVEALWMGVPVLTKRGSHFLSHIGEAIAQNAGLPDWIAADDEDYVTKAVAFAADIDHLAHLRGRLRAQLRASPLCDAPRFARHFEAAMAAMWAGRAGQA